MQDLWLSRYARLTAVATLGLILIGSLVTTNGAGMAFADWPLSSGSLNPPGWWSHVLERLEHGHRLYAEFTGCLVGILCAWVWSNPWAVPAAFVSSGVLSMIAKFAGAPRPVIAHVGIWSSAVVFALMLLWRSPRPPTRPASIRWFSFAAFCGVIAQAVLGGFRVTVESSGNYNAALALRIVHGCFAQIEFSLVAVTAALLFFSSDSTGVQGLKRIRTLGWMTFGFIFLQLVFGATIRHMGAALAIPSFPAAGPGGRFMPATHNALVDTNFTHTRFIALLVLVHVVLLARRIFKSAGTVKALIRPAYLLLALIGLQIAFGVSIIWTYRAHLPATLHVVNGALVLATALIIAVRSSILKENGSTPSISNLQQTLA